MTARFDLSAGLTSRRAVINRPYNGFHCQVGSGTARAAISLSLNTPCKDPHIVDVRVMILVSIVAKLPADSRVGSICYDGESHITVVLKLPST